MLFFFFSSRRRHTRCLSDWSSDVCSSDLATSNFLGRGGGTAPPPVGKQKGIKRERDAPGEHIARPRRGLRWFWRRTGTRSEERRVGKECRSRWWPDD